MAIWEILQKAERNIRKCTESTFGDETIQKQLEVRRQILEQVESRIIREAAGKFFPYERISIRFYPPSKELQEGFRISCLQDDSLKADILLTLQESRARSLENLAIFVDLEQSVDPGHRDSVVHYEMEFVKPDPSSSREVPKVKFVVSRGVAEHPEYCMCKEHILIGRSLEVIDREGRVIRKNDLVFSDNGEDVNSTVAYAHARIWWDYSNQEFLIMDEVSRYGTCIVRGDRSLEVPAGNPCGIRLQSGDEIYCGQACLHFELVSVHSAFKE
jgi:hypothetical protein